MAELTAPQGWSLPAQAKICSQKSFFFRLSSMLDVINKGKKSKGATEGLDGQ